jgi:hypothetical protein
MPVPACQFHVTLTALNDGIGGPDAGGSGIDDTRPARSVPVWK